MTDLMLVDRWGRPVNRTTLTTELGGPTLGGVRSPLAGYPGDGLDPGRLAQILREADRGDPLRYLELAETIEERDPHYLGVLATRKRSVSQIDISVEAASDAPEDVAQADMIRDWLLRDELTDEIFNILDCIGKGYSFTEIVWDASEGQLWPRELRWWDPRWFRFDRQTLSMPVMLGVHGDEQPLDPFRFIFASIQAKSGLVLRSGLARVAAWGWMFKAYTQRDWAIFTQTYGQPIRIGKYQEGASDKDKDTLFRAVANIAGDCAAIIPQSMSIDFIEAKSIGASSDLYEKRSDWLDRQISKAVLGQTATTDAIAGGHAVGQEHRQVQEDIERADCKALAAILNRDLIRPWIDLERGPQKRYPRLIIKRPEREDLAQLVTALGTLVPLGLRVQASEIRDKFALSDPDEGAEILSPPGSISAAGEVAATPPDQTSKIKRFSGKIKRYLGSSGIEAAQSEEGPSAVKIRGSAEIAQLEAEMATEGQVAIDRMVGTIEVMMEKAGSLDEFRRMIVAGFPDLDESAFAEVIVRGLVAASLAGRASVEKEGA